MALKKIAFIVSVLLFFVNINYNLFSIVSEQKYTYSENEISESLVLGRLLNVEKNGLLADGLFTGTPKVNLKKNKKHAFIKTTYFSNESFDFQEFDTYNSQNGGQAILYSIFDQVFKLNNTTNFKIFRAFNSLLLSIALSLFLFWCYECFSTLPTIIVFLFTYFSPWLLMYGRSTWWCEWTFLLFFSILLLLLKKNIKPKKYIQYFSLFVFIKLWFNGFEFITTYLIGITSPFILYYFNKFRSNKFILKSIISHFLSILVSISIYLCILLVQFRIYKGSFIAGIQHITNAFERRSSSSFEYTQQSEFLRILESLRLDVIIRYLGNNAFDLSFFHIKTPFVSLVLLGIFTSIFLYIKNKKLKPLIIVSNLSILAPISWFFIFNQHAHIHTHIDFMIWYFPYLLFVFLLIGLSVHEFINKKNVVTL